MDPLGMQTLIKKPLSLRALIYWMPTVIPEDATRLVLPIDLNIRNPNTITIVKNLPQ